MSGPIWYSGNFRGYHGINGDGTTRGPGHCVVITGLVETKGTSVLCINDPWPPKEYEEGNENGGERVYMEFNEFITKLKCSGLIYK